jgi:hypothetical protein
MGIEMPRHQFGERWQHGMSSDKVRRLHERGNRRNPMTTNAQVRFADLAFELRFEPLIDDQAPLTFPCDAHGHVDLDELCDRSRCDYLFAHTLIGRHFTVPVIRACLGV